MAQPAPSAKCSSCGQEHHSPRPPRYWGTDPSGGGLLCILCCVKAGLPDEAAAPGPEAAGA